MMNDIDKLALLDGFSWLNITLIDTSVDPGTMGTEVALRWRTKHGEQWKLPAE